MELASIAPHKQVVVLIGPVGSGKTSLFNALKLDVSIAEVIDPSGFGNSASEYQTYMQQLVHILKNTKVRAFVLVLNGTSLRFNAEMFTILQAFMNYVGKSFFEHLVVVVTRWEGDKRSRRIREQKQISEEKYAMQWKTNLNNVVPEASKIDIPFVFIDSEVDCSIEASQEEIDAFHIARSQLIGLMNALSTFDFFVLSEDAEVITAFSKYSQQEREKWGKCDGCKRVGPTETVREQPRKKTMQRAAVGGAVVGTLMGTAFIPGVGYAPGAAIGGAVGAVVGAGLVKVKKPRNLCVICKPSEDPELGWDPLDFGKK